MQRQPTGARITKWSCERFPGWDGGAGGAFVPSVIRDGTTRVLPDTYRYGDKEKPSTDRELWLHVKDGDGAAFASFFVRHRDRVFVHSLRLVKTPFEAEDVTAMVFLEAWRCRSRIRLVNDSILGWLLITATNVARNKIRSRLRYERLLRKIEQ